VSLGIVLASTLTLSLYQWIEYRLFQNVFTDLAADQLAIADRIAQAERFAISQSLRIASLFSIMLLIPLCAVAAIRIVRPIYSVTVEAMNLTQANPATRINNNGRDIHANEAKEIKTALSAFTQRIESAEDELMQERSRALLILNSLDEGIALADSNGIIGLVNPSVQEVLQVQTGELLPEPLFSLARTALSLNELTEMEMTTGDRVYSCKALPLEAEGSAVCVLRDATEAARLEQTRRDYIANVSHELRSPLTALRCMIEPLRDGLIKDDARRFDVYDILLNETLRLSRLVDDMLELSRLQSGRLALEKIKFDLAALVNQTLDTIEPRVLEKNQTLERRVNAMPECCSNPDRIEQILMALLDNAIKFTPEGGSITVSSSEENGHAVIEVSDTGVGIPKEDLAHVFDRFYKADKAHTGGGTGLGLAISRELAERLGGTITAANNIGGGASIKFTVSMQGSVL
jgi:signal transduction histidine kinase